MALTFSTLAADGSSTALSFPGGAVRTMFVIGDLGSGTLTLEFSIDSGTTWDTVKDVPNGVTIAFAEEGIANVDLRGAVDLRVTLAGSTDPDFTAGWL